jgi:hypothetical protein
MQFPLDDMFDYPALPPRRRVTVGAKLLAGVMAGVVHCHWGAWVQTHYRGYSQKGIADASASLDVWSVDHTYLLDREIAALRSEGWQVARENQNWFELPLRNGVVLTGKPDLVALDPSGAVSIRDAKTGKPRASDVAQVLIYMWAWPQLRPEQTILSVSGEVVQSNGVRKQLPAPLANSSFGAKIEYFAAILGGTAAPLRAPSRWECLYCPVSREVCTDRLMPDSDD